jgi:hypothetical protein
MEIKYFLLEILKTENRQKSAAPTKQKNLMGAERILWRGETGLLAAPKKREKSE